MRDFFRREFAPIGTDDEDGPAELLESGRMYRAGLRENAKAGQAAYDKPEKHSNKKRADKAGTQTNVYRTDNTIDSGKATRRGAHPAKAAHHGSFISVSPALIALCALAPLLGQGRLMAMTLGVLAVHEAAHIACARVLGVPIGRLRRTPLGASLELDARLITPRNESKSTLRFPGLRSIWTTTKFARMTRYCPARPRRSKYCTCSRRIRVRYSTASRFFRAYGATTSSATRARLTRT